MVKKPKEGVMLTASTIVESLIALLIISIVVTIGLTSISSIYDADHSYQEFKARNEYEKYRIQLISDNKILYTSSNEQAELETEIVGNIIHINYVHHSYSKKYNFIKTGSDD